MSTTDYATKLHNYFQNRNEVNRISYAEIPSGPAHDQTWTFQCKIDGQIKGTGKGASKPDAKQAAAKAAFVLLNPYGDAA